jgi:hypothetical protein
MNTLRSTLELHEKTLHGIPGCTATAIGKKIVKGVRTDQDCITVFVQKKQASPPPEQHIPRQLGEAVTDVVEKVFSFSLMATDPNARFDPLIGGISAGSAGALGGGSIGCFIISTGNAHVAAGTYMMTNFHVLQNGAGGVDARVLQPFADPITNQVMGTYVYGQRGPAFDCAIASIQGRGYRNEVPNHPLRMGNRAINNQTAVAAVNDRVYKYGATTQHTVGIVHNIAFAIPNQVQNAIYIVGENNGLWCGPGDSGSIALRYDNDRAVGLNFMEDTSVQVEGGSGAGLAYDIQTQMNVFGAAVRMA